MHGVSMHDAHACSFLNDARMIVPGGEPLDLPGRCLTSRACRGHAGITRATVLCRVQRHGLGRGGRRGTPRKKVALASAPGGGGGGAPRDRAALARGNANGVAHRGAGGAHAGVVALFALPTLFAGVCLAQNDTNVSTTAPPIPAPSADDFEHEYTHYHYAQLSILIVVLGLWCLACGVGTCFPGCLANTFDVPDTKAAKLFQDVLLCQGRRVYHEGTLDVDDDETTKMKMLKTSKTCSALSLIVIAVLQFTRGAIVEQHVSFSGHGFCEPGAGFECFEAYITGGGTVFDDQLAANCTHGYPAHGDKYMSCYRMRDGSLGQVLKALGTATGTVALLYASAHYGAAALVRLKNTKHRYAAAVALMLASLIGLVGLLVATFAFKTPVAAVDQFGIIALLLTLSTTGVDVLLGREALEDIHGPTGGADFSA